MSAELLETLAELSRDLDCLPDARVCPCCGGTDVSVDWTAWSENSVAGYGFEVPVESEDEADEGSGWCWDCHAVFDVEVQRC